MRNPLDYPILSLLALATVLGISVPLVLGFLKDLHWAFDSFAHFRGHLAFLLILAAVPLLFGPLRIQGIVALALGIGAFASVLGASPFDQLRTDANASGEERARYKLLQINLRYDNATPKEVLSLIGRTQADVVTLNEVSGMWLRELEFITGAYPHRLICPRPSRIGGVAILSRRPFLHPAKAQCFDHASLALATLNFGGTTVDIAAIHMGWPWPYGQQWQIPRVKPILEQLGPTAILAGDLNATPWSAAARQLAAAGKMRVLGDIGPTWLAYPAPNMLRRLTGLPIDNLFVKGGVQPLSTKRLEYVGSDHLPVLLEFSVVPSTSDENVLQAEKPAPALSYMF